MHSLPPRDWRLSDDDFQTIRTFFERKDPSQRTPDWTRREVEALDREIDGNLAQREESWRDAILILLQGRNFLARYIGEQERLIPEECYEGEDSMEQINLDEEPSMRIPKRTIIVAIVDDEPTMANGMRDILTAWPDIRVDIVLQDKGLPVLPLNADIILLDEAMKDGMTGTIVFEWLKSHRFRGIIASTTGGSQPPYVRHHFQQKSTVATSRKDAKAFVRFMNSLIAQL